jgi:hypothetical protein
MKTIKLILTLLFVLIVSVGYGQTSDRTPIVEPKTDVLNSKNKTEYKFFDTSYDAQNIRVRRVNDTLNIFVEGQRKISIAALNIVELEAYGGFEKDVDGFFEMVEKLNLDFKNKSYKIRYSPAKKEIIVSERDEYRFKAFDGAVLPIFRHNIIFTYQAQMLDISFFLGEIDELMVFKEAGFSDTISKEALTNNWFAEYGKTRFNKDLRIDAQGEIQIITYKNIESSREIQLGFNLGMNFLGNLFPIDQELFIIYKPKNFNKWVQKNSGFFVSFNTYSFLSRNDEKKINLDNSFFLNVGFITGYEKLPIRFYYGRLISDNEDNDDFFIFNRNKIGVDILVNNLIRVKSEAFLGSDDSDGIITLGVSLNLFNN